MNSILFMIARFNGNPKRLQNHKEFVKEYASYKNLKSLELEIVTSDGSYWLSLLSSIWFLLTEEIAGAETIKKNIKLLNKYNGGNNNE